MGVIAAFLGSAFTGVTSLITIFLGRKLAFSAAYIAVFLVIATTFILVIQGILGSIVSAFPSNSLLVAGFSLLPSNTTQCIGFISAAHLASYAYSMKFNLLKLKVQA